MRRTGDAGLKNDAATPAGLACGTSTCTVSDKDLAWGAEACCVDKGKSVCGVKADKPVVMAPDAGTMPIGDVLAKLLVTVSGDAGIMNTMPKIPCLPKDAPGTPSKKCDSETINLSALASLDAGSEDAGSSSATTYVIVGCCRPDGMCGYADDTTGLGCVKVSQSLVGQVLGRKDKSCK